MITIYGSKNWEWTRDSRASWLLEEKNIPFLKIELDLMKGEQKETHHLQRHPLGKVPVLLDGNTQIFESGAILTYLAEKYAPDLIPENEADRALYYQWMFFINTSMEPAIVKIFVNTYLFPVKDGSQSRRQEGLGELKPSATYLDEKLAQSEYLVGDKFTAADIMLASALYWANLANAMESYPNLQRYFIRLSNRAAFKKTFDPSKKTYSGASLRSEIVGGTAIA